jgi:hypothetical protein
MFNRLLALSLFLVIALTATANPLRPDPISTQPQVKSSTPKPVVRVVRLPILENIVIIGDYRKAIFQGNKEISEGNVIGDYLLLSVNQNSVVLKRGQQLKTLFLKTSGEVMITPVKED